MYHILYVDDEPDLLEIGKLFLEKGGQFSVDIQTSASAGLTLLSSANYDAIVSDYQMPDMDGIEFLKKVRTSGSTIPFILFTGRGREEVVIQALNEGADFYLQKGGQPLAQFTELAHHVRQAVQQRQAEVSIRDHEQREADIINFLPDATFAIDTNGVVIAWNRAMEKMTGVLADKILGKGNYEYAIPFYHERSPILIDLVLSDSPAAEARYPHITRAGKKLFSEITIPHMNDGKGASIWFTASPLYDTRGVIVGAIESIRDITERKQAESELRAAYEQLTATEEELRRQYRELTENEQKLRQSEARYRNVVEVQTELISRFRHDGTHVFVNEAYCRYFGKSREEIIGHIFIPDIPREDRANVKLHFASLTPSHFVDSIDHRIIMPDGEVRWQRWNDRAIFDEKGNVTEFQSVGRDITERKRVEEEITFKNIIQSTQQENSLDGILIVDESGKILNYNQKFIEILGIPDNLIASRRDEPVLQFIAGQIADPGAFLSRVRYLYDHKEERSFEELLLKDGRIMERFSAPMLGEKKKYYGRVWYFRDITERKRAEEALRQANRKLTLLSDITRHDINNQITMLTGFLSILEKKQPDLTLSEYFQKISTTAQRISAMIRFTKEYEKIGVHAPVWQGTRALVGTAAKEAPLGKVMVKNDLPGGTEVFADPMIVKVFYNLMDNAVRYNDTITTIRFSVQESGDDHVIICEDEGGGIPVEEKAKIFDRGFGKNTGMGLFLAREILSITGITISETGEPGKGARFEMTIPKGAYRLADVQ